MFLNEFAINEKTNDRKYEWTSIEVIINSHELLKYTEKWNILSLYTMNDYISWDIIQGLYNIELFNEFVKNHVISWITLFSRSHLVLIMNNYIIHRVSDNSVILLLVAKLLMIESYYNMWECRNSTCIFIIIFTRLQSHREILHITQDMIQEKSRYARKIW